MLSASDGFAHARPGRQDDQVGLLEAAQQLVQLAEAGRHAQQIALVAVQIVQPVDDAVHDLADGRQVAPDAPLRDVEDQLLGAVDHLIDILRLLVGQRRDLPGRADQPPQGGGAFDDVAVVLDVDGGGDAADQRGDVGRAADLRQLIAPLQLVDQRDEIGGFAALVQIEDRLVDPAVLLSIEVVGLQEGGDLDDCVRVDQERAEDGLFGFRIGRDGFVGRVHGSPRHGANRHTRMQAYGVCTHTIETPPSRWQGGRFGRNRPGVGNAPADAMDRPREDLYC